MSEHSNISWTDASWPIVAGCEYESPGCSNCWAVRDSWRLAHSPHAHVREAFRGVVRKTDDGKLVWTGLMRPLPERLDWPLHWKTPRRIFVCNMADLFHSKVPFPFIAASFGIMAMARQHTFQVLTKHADRMREFFAWIENDDDGPTIGCVLHAREKCGVKVWKHEPDDDGPVWPLPNVHLGVTAEDRKRAEQRLPYLIDTPAAKRFISYEPALELVSFAPWLKSIDWLIFGGESAQTRATTRECDIDWGRHALAECRAAGTAFFNKQLGTIPIWHGSSGPGEHWPEGAVREDTGRGYFRMLPPAGKNARYKWHEPEYWPEDLRIQEFPS